MICSMCPTLRLSRIHAPRHGWQCICRAIHCSHVLQCPDCQVNRYELERQVKTISREMKRKESASE